MEVKPIRGNSPSFNGYLNKSVYNFVDSALRNECNRLIDAANREKKIINKNSVINLNNLKDDVLNSLEAFMEKTHKNTSLEIIEPTEINIPVELVIRNPIAPTKQMRISPMSNSVYSASILERGSYQDSSFDIFIANSKNIFYPNEHGLKSLKIIGEELNTKITPKQVDKSFLLMAHDNLSHLAKDLDSFVKKFKLRKYAQSIDKYAQEIGEDSVSAKSKIPFYIDRYKEIVKTKKQLKQVQKENSELIMKLQKYNEKIVENILSGKA